VGTNDIGGKRIAMKLLYRDRALIGKCKCFSCGEIIERNTYICFVMIDNNVRLVHEECFKKENEDEI